MNLKHEYPELKNVWEMMIQRCTNPRANQYKDYGGRGIKVCKRWRRFRHFIDDMHPRPDGMTLDRIENDGDYEPGNCRWATRATQQRGRRRDDKGRYMARG